MTDGVHVREWVATHRQHHRYTDLPGDPHSPHIEGINTIVFKTFIPACWYRYRNFKPKHIVDMYSKGIPDDWVERNVYVRYQRLGLLIMLWIDIMLFGATTGIIIWLIQMIWTPLWSGSIVTGYGHWIGYRNKNNRPTDLSTNLVPWGIIVVGDELHSNHHARPNDPNLRHRWFEFDLGFVYIKLFETLGLLKIKANK